MTEIKERKNFYKTLIEAKEAVKRLGIKDYKSYLLNYKKDPFLSADLRRTYKYKGWTNWHDFFDKPYRETYKTYEETKSAANALGIKTGHQYYKEYKKDPRLMRKPYVKFKGKGWIDWASFLKKRKYSIIPTLAKAKVAAKKLGVKSKSDYDKRYRIMPGLPSNPWIIYKNIGWIGWGDFLGKKPKAKVYETLEEVKEAAGKLGIKSCIEYFSKYKNDPRLPRSLFRKFKNKGWEGWGAFFNKKKNEFYKNIEDAKASVKRLGIKSTMEYGKRRFEDSMLHSDPDKYYKDTWKNWYNFFDKKKPRLYAKYNDAKNAAIKLGIKSSIQYQKYYTQDKRLPAHPNKKYRDKGWINWAEFLGQND